MIYFLSFILMVILFNQFIILLKIADICEELDFNRYDIRCIKKLLGGERWKK